MSVKLRSNIWLAGVSAVAMLASGASALAQSVTITGDVSPSPADSPTWNVLYTIYVGFDGHTGTMTIAEGGTVRSEYGVLGLDSGSLGIVNVTGRGSKWQANNSIVVGEDGEGRLTIADGGTVTTRRAIIGAEGFSGTVKITGTGSSWLVENNLDVGGDSSGTLTINDGAIVSARNVAFTYKAGASGTINLDGTESRGVLETHSIENEAGSGFLNLNGGILRTTADQLDFLSGFANLTIGDGGAFFDSNGYAIGVATNFIGSSSLNKLGAGTLTLSGDSSGFAGATNIAEGTLNITGQLGSGIGLINYANGGSGSGAALVVTGPAAVWQTIGNLDIGQDGTGQLIVENGGSVTNAYGSIAGGTGSSGSVEVKGGGSSWQNTVRLDVGRFGRGDLTIFDGGTVTANYGTIGADNRALGTVRVTDEGSKLQYRYGADVGYFGNGTLTISRGGRVTAGGGTDTKIIVIATKAQATGTLTIGSEVGDNAVAAGVLEASHVSFGSGTGRLVFNHTGNTDGSDYVFAPAIQGLGAINQHHGTTLLSGDSSAFTGTTDISGGTLRVNGTLGGTVAVGSRGTLGGSGRLTGDATVDGTLSAGNSPGTLTVAGNLTLTADSTSRFELNTPGVVGGTGNGGNDHVVVGGALTLGGTLEARVAAAGYYRLFDYGTRIGTFANETLTSTNSDFSVDSYRVQYAVPGQVNLFVLGAEQGMQFWDGAQTVSNNTVDGDFGTWSGLGTNWTDESGSANSRWGGSVGVFSGTAGTVTVEGTQSFDTLHFTTTGYILQDGNLAIAAAGGGTLNIDPNVTVTIDSSIGGDTSLNKLGYGEVILTGANTYTGGTRLQGGTLSVSNDSNLGALSTVLYINIGTFRVTGTGYTTTDRAINIGDNYGIFDIADAANSFTLTGNITGTGFLYKLGAGSMVLTGSNLYRDTVVAEGTLVGDVASISGGVLNAGSVVFDQAVDAVYSRNVRGLGTDGTMIKRGAGTLSLAGTSSLDWSVEAGGLVSATDRFTGGIAVDAGGSFTFDQATDGTYAGSLSGTGSLVVSGGGAVSLTADNTGFVGTTAVRGGSGLVVANALGGDVNVERGTVSGTGVIGGALSIGPNGTLAGRAGEMLAVGGDLTLSGGSAVNAALGGASTAALFDVGGDLTLDGTLNVSDAGGFGAGVYNLFSYRGALADNGLNIGAVPQGVNSSDLTVQTAVRGRVNLVSSGGADLAFWDGGNPSLHDNGAVDGGTGIWRADGRNWTDLSGVANGPFRPNPTFAIFQGTGGIVTVDDGAGALGVTGMQFVSNGYVITGDPIALEGSDGQSIIRVGDGTASGSGVTTTIASTLTGTSDLVKEDRGALVLTGANTYGGNTLVRAGTVVGNTASLRGDIANAGAVVFDQAEAASFGGDIAGLGGTVGVMRKRGAGVLTLAGTSSLDWAVEGGGLMSTADRFYGDLALASGTRFAFDQATAGTYSGTLVGTGAFAVTGGGTVRLTGGSAGYRGLTEVVGSTLSVDGQLGGSALIGQGGVLKGTGSLGTGTGSNVTIATGGTLSPGNSPGTLTVNGDLVFDAGSRYEVEVVPGTATSDRVAATGSAALNGGTVAHVGLAGAYNPTATWTILTADGGVNGTFGTVTSDFAFLEPALGYGANAVSLTLSRNDAGFASVGETGNQRSTANGVESLGAGDALYNAIAPLDAATARGAFDQLSGEVHASVRSGLIEDSRFLRDAVSNRIEAAFSGTLADTAPLAGSDTTAWLSAYGSFREIDGNGNAAKLDHNSGGFFVGADAPIGERSRIGLVAGYGTSDFDLDARQSSAQAHSGHVGLYASTDASGFEFDAGTAYSFNKVSTRRSVALAAFSDSLSADYDANTAQVFGEAGFRIQLGEATLKPFVGLAYVNLEAEGSDEDGGNAGLFVQGQSQDATFTTLGVRGSTNMALGNTTLTVSGMAGWRHAFGDVTPASTAAFKGGTSFSVEGVPLSKDAAVIELGLGLAIAPNASFDLDYVGQFGSRSTDNGIKASFNARF